MPEKGLIQVYYGEGKGKTTASLGLILRAVGHNWRVLLIQFFKNAFTGEMASLQCLPGCYGVPLWKQGVCVGG